MIFPDVYHKQQIKHQIDFLHKKNRMGRLKNGLSMRFSLELEMGLEPTTY